MSETSRYRCCDRFDWVPVADFGHVGGMDLHLGRCAHCSLYVMAVFDPQEGSLTRVCLTNAEAQTFLRRQSDPAGLEAVLQAWVG